MRVSTILRKAQADPQALQEIKRNVDQCDKKVKDALYKLFGAIEDATEDVLGQLGDLDRGKRVMMDKELTRLLNKFQQDMSNFVDDAGKAAWEKAGGR